MFDRIFVDPLKWLIVAMADWAGTVPLPPGVSPYAVSLVLIAIIIKLVTYPLTVTQLKSMRAMQALQPKLRELQQTHKKDREALAQKQMELYKSHGVNPFGGCLPLLLQMPILIGLFRALTNMGDTFHGQGLFWIPDLSVREPLPSDDPAGLPILLIVMTITQFWYQKFMTPPSANQDPQAEAMNQIMKFTPIMFAFIFINFPAGLVLYYTVFNVASVVQGWFINRQSGIQGLSLPVAGTSDPEPAADTPITEEIPANEPKRRRRRSKSR